MNRFSPSHITPGVLVNRIVLAVLTISALAFAVVVLSSQMLLAALAAAVVLAILCLVAVMWGLSLWRPSKVRRNVATVLSLLFCALFVVGVYYVQITVNALKEITSGGTETATMAVYVRSQDTRGLEDLLEERFGVLEDLDQFNTDAALMKIQEEHYVMVNTKGYSSATELVDALLNQDTSVILMNCAYLDAISELDGYTDISTKLREVATYTIYEDDKTAAPNPVPLPSSNADKKNNTFSVYISGSDSRSDDILATGRSDVNIIATINPDTRQILLLSTPRDYYVPLSIADESSLPDKLTHAGIYGVDVSMDTLAQLYDMDIDYYFRVNFNGFEDIIDALGGIDVNCQVEFTSGGYHFQPGIISMDGQQALSYVRERYAFSNGDYQRGIHQMQVISAVIQKAMSPSLLKSYSTLLEAVSNSFVTSVPYDLVSKLVRSQLLNDWDWNIVSYYVSGSGASEYTYSIPNAKAYVTIPDTETVETAKKLIDQVYAGQVISAP